MCARKHTCTPFPTPNSSRRQAPNFDVAHLKCPEKPCLLQRVSSSEYRIWVQQTTLLKRSAWPGTAAVARRWRHAMTHAAQ